MKKMYALHNFWSSFEWKAYNAYTVPDRNAVDSEGNKILPSKYITYEASSDSFGHEIAQTAMLYDRSSSWEEITEKEEEIAETISRGGVLIPFDDGAFWIKKGNPWAQRMDESDDDLIRAIVLNYTIEFLD